MSRASTLEEGDSPNRVSYEPWSYKAILVVSSCRSLRYSTATAA